MSRSPASQTKAVVRIGYQHYVLPLNKATQLLELLSGAIAVEYDDERGSRYYRLDHQKPLHPTLEIVSDDQLDIAPPRLRALPAPR